MVAVSLKIINLVIVHVDKWIYIMLLDSVIVCTLTTNLVTLGLFCDFNEKFHERKHNLK